MPFVDRMPGEPPGHTPETCSKVLGLQAQVEAVKTQLEKAHTKIDCLESKLDDNTQKTDRIFEIVAMGEGFFKGVKFTGKWLRKAIMWVVPPIAAVIGLWQALTSRTP